MWDHREQGVKTVGQLLLLRFFITVENIKQRLLCIIYVEKQWEPRRITILLPGLELRHHLNFLELWNCFDIMPVDAGT